MIKHITLAAAVALSTGCASTAANNWELGNDANLGIDYGVWSEPELNSQGAYLTTIYHGDSEVSYGLTFTMSSTGDCSPGAAITVLGLDDGPENGLEELGVVEMRVEFDDMGAWNATGEMSGAHTGDTLILIWQIPVTDKFMAEAMTSSVGRAQMELPDGDVTGVLEFDVSAAGEAINRLHHACMGGVRGSKWAL